MRAAAWSKCHLARGCSKAFAVVACPSKAGGGNTRGCLVAVPRPQTSIGQDVPACHLGYSSSTAARASDLAGTSSTSSNASRPRVCILGGGFGGLYTAIKLELLMWPTGRKPQITLVDQGERFVFKPLLYELLNGTAQSWEVAPTFAQLLAPYNIQYVQGTVSGVEPEQMLTDGGSASGGVVQLVSGVTLPYDWLVVALGAAVDPRDVPGIKEHARAFNSLPDAEFVAGRLAAFEARAALGQQPQASIVVVGGGYAGVELAAVVGERMRGKAAVALVTPGETILETAPAGQRQAAEEALLSSGVTLITCTKVTGVQKADTTSTAAKDPSPPAAPAEDQVVAASSAADPPGSSSNAAPSGNGSHASSGSSADASYLVQLESLGPSTAASSMTADLVLWTAGAKPASSPLQPFPLDPRGQLETDATLRVVKHARVFALGDVSRGQVGNDGSSGSSGFYPATAQVAFQQADYAAWNIWAAINDRALLPFRYQHLGDMMSLGSTNAAVALPVQVPPELTSSISGTPLSSALSLVGIKLTPGAEGLVVEGPAAQLLRRAAYLYRQPTNEQRLSVAASWIEQAVTTAARVAAELSAAGNKGSDSSRQTRV